MVKKSHNLPDSPLVSIVILNWNGANDTVRCVESVKNQNYKNIEIIVVDNGSENDLKTLLSIKGRLVKIVQNKKNLGFAGGHVSALPHCQGEFIFILNNDALVEKETIVNAVKRMNRDPSIAVVGGRSYHLTDEGTSAGFYSYQRVDPSTADVHTYGSDDEHPKETVTVSGSAALIRRSVIDTIGYFDERFFAYYEETDLFALYLRVGYKIVYDPSVKIRHKDGASTRNKKYMYYYLMLKNQYLFAFKNFDSPHLRGFLRIHFRHFLRSLWVYAKDRGSVEAIHRARVWSSLWNWIHILGTLASRVRRLRINRGFNYSDILEQRQPLDCTIVIDLRGANEKTTLNTLEALSRPTGAGFKEVLFITNRKYTLPKHSHTVTHRLIVDKGSAQLSQYEYGLMSSNTNYLFFLPASSFNASSLAHTTHAILSLLRKAAAHEHKIILTTTAKSDFNLTQRSAALIGIEKKTLVNFVSADSSLVELNNGTLSRYLAWLVMSCEPILRTTLAVSNKQPLLKTGSTQYPILNNRYKWQVKKALRTLHLTRLIKKVAKFVSRSRADILSTPTPDRSTKQKQASSLSAKEMAATPVFINLRDRLEPLKQLVEWLERSGMRSIYFIDNDSTYSPLLEYLERTPHQVISLGRNGMHKAPWESFAIRFIAKQKHYIVSDPDIVPADSTPRTTVKRMYEVLKKYPQVDKVGVALKIDNIPEHYSLRQSVIQWESRFWDKSLELEPNVFQADVDTTLALYRPSTWWFLSPSARLAGKYSMMHEPWYQSLESPTEDMMYYRARASSEVSTWVKGKLPKHHLRALKKEGLL